MSRFAWIQFRAQAAVVFGGLLIVAIILAFTGPHLLHLYDTNVATCAKYSDCSTAASSFLRNDRALQILLDALVIVVPGVVGIFWGAPLVSRELETGTYRLVWTQSVTRFRWIAVKLGVVGLASMVAAGLLSLVVTWWSSPIDRVNMTLYTSFDQRGIVPIGYAAFAFAFGVLAGVVIRRTVPAMAATLVGFVAARLLFNHFVLPKLVAPTRRSFALNLGTTVGGFGRMNGGPPMFIAGDPNVPNAWIYSTQFVDRTGHALTSQVLTKACPLLVSSPGPGQPVGGGKGRLSVSPVPAGAQSVLQNCVTKIGATYHEVVAYQPASRYWPFQWYELLIYLGVALVLAGACVWWVRRRLA